MEFLTSAIVTQAGGDSAMGDGMRRFVLGLFIVIAVWMPSAQADAQRPYAQGLLWRIDGGAGASYVFGTVHITDPRVHEVARQMLQTVGAVDSITLEILQTPEAIAEIAQRMVITGGPGLSQMAGAELFAQTVDIAAPYGMTAAILDRFKPWAVAITLSVPVSEMHARASGGVNTDGLLEAHAQANQIALHALESLDEQLGLFDRLTQADQIEMLRIAVRDGSLLDDVFTKLVDEYLARDLDAIYRLLEEQATGQTERLQSFFGDELIDARNKRMVERMQARLAEGNALIAVGALHLPGEDGLLRLLEQRGYTIQRMD